MDYRDLAPPGYAIDYWPIEGDNAPFRCPYEMCDGMLFLTAAQCISHHLDWHDGPYVCPECRATLGSQHTLMRHARSSGHSQAWRCKTSGCESNGVAFANQKAFEDHFLTSLLHKFKRNSEENDSDASNDSTSDEDEPYVCHIRGCHKFDIDFKCPSEWARHESAAAHINASNIAQTLQQQCTSALELDIKFRAMRKMVCFDNDCPLEGVSFKTARGYFKHLETHNIAEPRTPSAAGETEDTVSDTESNPELVCQKPECEKYGYCFSNAGNFTLHMRSTAHGSVPGSPSEPDEEPLTKRARFMSPLIGFGNRALPTPETPAGRFALDTSTSPLARRGRPTTGCSSNGDQASAVPESSKGAEEGDVSYRGMAQRLREMEQRFERLEEEVCELRSESTRRIDALLLHLEKDK